MKSGVKKDEGSRLLHVYETWRRTRLDPMKLSWRGATQLPALRSIVAVLLAVLLGPIDANLWRFRDTPFAFDFLGIFHWTVLAAAVLTGSILNAWLLDRLVSRKTAGERSFRRGILFLRRIFSVLPVLNFLVFPFWQWVLLHLPQWALRPAPPGTTAPLPRLAEAPSSQVLILPSTAVLPGPKGLVFSVLACNMVSLTALCNLYSRLHPTTFLRSAFLGASSLCFHLTAFLCILLELRAETRAAGLTRWRSLALSALSCLWLPPIPWMPLGAFLIQIPFLPSTSQGKTLIHQSFRSRTDPGRTHSWSELRGALRSRWGHLPWWQRWRRPPGNTSEEAEAGKTLSRRLVLHDLKAFLLLPDMTALVLILMPTPGHDPFRELLVKGLLGFAILGVGLCFLAGLVINTMRLASALLHSSTIPPSLDRPYYGYLLTVPVTFFIGLWVALAIRYEKPDSIRPAIQLIAVVFLWLQIPYLFLGDRWLRNIVAKRGVMAILLRLLMFQIAIVIPAQLATASRLGVERKAALLWLSVSFLVSLLFGSMLLPWLVRPYRWSEIFNSNVPLATRSSMVLLGITTAVPLGGAAIPVWLAIRRLLRIRT